MTPCVVSVDDQQGAVIHLGDIAGTTLNDIHLEDSSQTTNRKRRKINQCSLCGKAFSAPSHVARHMTVHTGQKFYSCPFCGRGLSQKVHLARHLKSCVMNPNRDTADKTSNVSHSVDSVTMSVPPPGPLVFQQVQGLNSTI